MREATTEETAINQDNEQSFDLSEQSEHQGSTMNNKQATEHQHDSDECNLSDNDSTINRQQDGALRALREQEAKIRQLESELDLLRASQTGVTETSPVSREVAAEESPYVNRLFVVSGSDQNLKYPLSKQLMTIGREPHNDIHVRSKFISRYHARIVSDKEGTVIEDLDSRNGIKVNSKRVRRKLLKSGDLVDIGRVQFKYIDLMEGSSGEGQA